MIRSLLTYLLSLLSVLCFGQSAGFLHYSVEDGLPQSQVHTIAQDGKGNLWIGTMSGASRFDGRNFKTFNVRNGLSENWVSASYTDKKGNVWLGHWSGGISVIPASGSKASKLPLPGIILTKSISDFVQTADSILWISTEGNGLIRFNINTNKAFRFDTGESNSDIYALAEANGNLYLAVGESILEIVDCNSSKPEVQVLLNGKDINELITAGNYLFYTDNGNLMCYKHGEVARHIAGPSVVKELFVDDQSRLWVATYGYGVYLFDKILSEEDSFRIFTERQGLNFDFANTVYQDDHGNIWIGTDLGVNLFAGEYMELYDKSAGLSNNLIWSVFSGKDGTIYAGSGSGVFMKSPSSSSFSKIMIPQLEGKAITAICQDITGKIWAGTMQSGVFVIENNRLIDMYGPEKYPFEKINRIASQQDGSVWIATDNGAGKISADKQVEWFTMDNGLLSDFVTTVFTDSKDYVWFGFTGNGIQCFANGRFTVPVADSMLSRATILSIIEDRVGNLWAGSYGEGLYMFDGQRIKNIPLNDGTTSDSPLSLVVDERNRIWFGTNRGIDCFDPVTQQFQHYGRKRGFQGVESNINAITRDKNGAIWFGCLLGALKMDPVEELVPAKAPVPTIDNVQLFFKDKELPSDNSFSHDQNHLSFNFSAVYLKDPEKVKYQFMLEGFDKDWSPLTDKPFVTYPNLPYGKYKFLVKSGFHEGVWSEPVEYAFEINPPFYRTWWFNIMAIGGITLFLMMVIELRARKSRNNKKHIELLVRERTIELGQKNMELARRNKELTDLIKKTSEVNSN